MSGGKVRRLTGFDAIQAISPELAQPLKRAIEAMQADRIVESLQHFATCAAIDPTNKAVLYFGSGVAQRAYFGLKHQEPQPPPEKLAQWRQAALDLTVACAEADPTDPVPLHNVGRFIQDDGDDAGSVEWYRRALALKRDQVETWGNLGTALYTLGTVSEAEACWSKAVAFPAVNASATLAQAYIWLRRGDYARGWPALNLRWQDEMFTASYGRKDLTGKPWTGQPLSRSDSLLVHGEQGLGDHVMFARYMPELIVRGFTVAALETRQPLAAWFRACLPDVPVVVRDAGELPPYTHHVPLLSLPGLLGLTDPVAPLEPPVSLSQRVTGRVGIVWKGAAGNVADAQRSIPPELLRLLADIPGVTWVPMAYDPSGLTDITARAWLGSRVESPPPFNDVLGSAEVMGTLDALVTVDTLAAHVAGSIGLPTYLLHRFNREWRWGQHAARCAWYPSVTQLTQPAPGDWAGVLEELRAQLLEHGPGPETNGLGSQVRDNLALSR